MFKFNKVLLVVGITSVLCLVYWSLVPRSLRPHQGYNVRSYGFTLKRLQEAYDLESIDILILGSSKAYRHFDTRFLEKKGYLAVNLGTSSQTPNESLWQYSKYVNQLRPKIVIIEVDPLLLSSDGVESTCDLISNFPLNETGELVLRNKSFIVLNTYLYRKFTELFLDYSKLNQSGTDNLDTYIPGGFVQRKFTSFWRASVHSHVNVIKSDQIRELKALYDWVKFSGSEVYLVRTPVTKIRHLNEENTLDFDSTMVAIAGDHYMNYVEQIELQDSIHFYDDKHMNQKGVELFMSSFMGTFEKYLQH